MRAAVGSAGARRPPRRAERRVALLGALALLIGAPADALAHGPAPGPLRVLGAEDGVADLIQLNIGVALHSQGDLYRYACPSTWGGAETPLSVALDRDTALIVGGDALYTSTDRLCTTARLDGVPFAPADVSSLVRAEGAALGVARGGGATSTSSRVFTWDRDGVVIAHTFDDLRFDSALAAEPGAGVARRWLAGARPAPTVAWTDDLSGASGWTMAQPTPGEGLELQRLTLRLVSASGVDYAATTASGAAWLRSDLGATRLEVVAQGERSVHGPIPLCGGVVALVDGEPVADPTRPPSCDLSGLAGRSLTCLGATGSAAWTCELRGLRRIEVDGERALLSPWFELEQLVGPQLDCPADSTARLACEQDWFHFGGEVGLINPDDPFGLRADDVPDDEPANNADPDGPDPDADAGADTGAPPGASSGGGGEGCQTRPGAPHIPPWALAAVLLAVPALLHRRRATR